VAALTALAVLPGVAVAAIAGAVLAVTGLALYQAQAGGPLVVVPGLALAPLLVSLLLSWQVTGFVALYTIGWVVALSLQNGQLLESATVLRVAGTAATCGFAVLNAAVRRRRETRLARMSQVAEVVQGAILHAVPAQLGGFAIASRYVSASQDALVGGDLFDAVATSRGLRVLVGDVRGKGLPAVRTAAQALAGFRQVAPRVELRLVDVATALEEALQGELGEEDFVTAVLCELGPAGILEVVNCGHPPPLLIPAHGAVRELPASQPSPPLGLGASPVSDRHVLAVGDRLLLFTDGLSEARNDDGQFLRPQDHVEVLRRADLQDALDGLLTAAIAHTGGTLGDDLAVLLLTPAPVHPPTQATRTSTTAPLTIR
jgi:hypothetical protein